MNARPSGQGVPFSRRPAVKLSHAGACRVYAGIARGIRVPSHLARGAAKAAPCCTSCGTLLLPADGSDALLAGICRNDHDRLREAGWTVEQIAASR